MSYGEEPVSPPIRLPHTLSLPFSLFALTTHACTGFLIVRSPPTSSFSRPCCALAVLNPVQYLPNKRCADRSCFEDVNPVPLVFYRRLLYSALDRLEGVTPTQFCARKRNYYVSEYPV
ncbi:hypothetical protein C8F04DRAFT_1275671 [Mycena alexandri]|uniref:Uncharacterized protein n=1 Tax=Mycena alexandri TaxID=1745969 RepID=A0AAD6S4U2_9AGAR|nr:hypothetical protein C8F04DRAFT_1275671 [Mycena alexandri]